MPRPTPKPGELYRHTNGRVYEIVAIARQDDLEVDFVVHKGLHDGRVWLRTVKNFLGDKAGTLRFKLLTVAQ